MVVLMDYSVIFCLVLAVGLAAAMTADVILDMETIWSDAGQFEVVQTNVIPNTRIADISWLEFVEPELPEIEADIIQLAKERMTSRLPNPGSDLWANLDAQFEQSKSLHLDYNSLTVKELKLIAKQRAIPKYRNMKKAELIAALQ
jgi:hypothetical protein